MMYDTPIYLFPHIVDSKRLTSHPYVDIKKTGLQTDDTVEFNNFSNTSYSVTLWLNPAALLV